MWHLALLIFLCAELSAEEFTTPPTTLPTSQPVLPTQRVDVQLLPDDQEPLENEDTESTLDSDPENLLTEAVRLLQIDTVQTLEKKLRLTENSLKEKEEELENTQKKLCFGNRTGNINAS